MRRRRWPERRYEPRRTRRSFFLRDLRDLRGLECVGGPSGPPLPARFDLPDLVAAVVGHQQTAVGGNRHPNRTSPPPERPAPRPATRPPPALDRRAALAVVDDEAGHEILERARLAIRHREECHAIT